MRYAIALAIFAVGCSSPTSPSPVTVTPPVAVVTPPTPMLPSDPNFDLAFFREFAHDALDHPDATRPVFHWTHAPNVYLRTIDDENHAIDSRILDQTAAAIINTTAQWTGGAFGVAGLERGTGTREGQPGWITVVWSATLPFCGRVRTVDVGNESAGIAMTLSADTACHCGSRSAMHELGHALGYYHTDDPRDVMNGTTFSCNRELSARERYHAQVVYGLPNGTRF